MTIDARLIRGRAAGRPAGESVHPRPRARQVRGVDENRYRRYGEGPPPGQEQERVQRAVV